MKVITDLKKLYEIDDSLWLEETIELLKNQEFAQLDLENLIEELEALGRNDKNAVSSFLEQIIRHLLLSEYWQSEQKINFCHWKAEIYSFRKQLNRKLTTNLQNYLRINLEQIYQDGLEYVKIKTDFTVDFPAKCPYSLEQLLDVNYLPEIS